VKGRFLDTLLLTTSRIEVINARGLKGCNLIAVCLVLYTGPATQIFPGILPFKRCGLQFPQKFILGSGVTGGLIRKYTSYKEYYINSKDLFIH
jgi:hypothetical protein